MRSVAALWVGLLALHLSASAQPPGMGREARGERSQALFFEAINLSSSDSSRVRVDVHYRLGTDFFVAVRNADTSFHWDFKRRGEILIELIDSTEVSRARDIHRIELGAASAEQSPEILQWYEKIVSFHVRQGPYKVIFEVDDLESSRKFVDHNTMFRAKSLKGPPLETSTPLFVFNGKPDSNSFRMVPQNFGGNLLFGKPSALFLQIPVKHGELPPVWVAYKISTVSPGDEKPELIRSDTLHHVKTFTGLTPRPVEDGETISYLFDSTGLSPALAMFVPLPSEELPLRNYELTLDIHVGDSLAHMTKPFHMVWPDMPHSLRDVDRALDALRYITTEQQLDSLKRGSFKDKRKNLEEFWKAKARYPATVYNDVMVQYYRRVDHAARTFGTLHDTDGAKTDRGRIFILYGPPANVDRTLSPTSGFEETWSYTNLKKKFIFLDRSKSGTYTLISTQPL
jgi:GWxTD domain-containing protein